MKKVLLLTAIFVLSTSLAFAACAVCKNANSSEYPNAAGGKLVRGIMNTAFGWTELFMRPGKEAARGENALIGFVDGLGNVISRTVGGVVEVATFWVPNQDSVVIKNCPICEATK